MQGQDWVPVTFHKRESAAARPERSGQRGTAAEHQAARVARTEVAAITKVPRAVSTASTRGGASANASASRPNASPLPARPPPLPRHPSGAGTRSGCCTRR